MGIKAYQSISKHIKAQLVVYPQPSAVDFVQPLKFQHRMALVHTEKGHPLHAMALAQFLWLAALSVETLDQQLSISFTIQIYSSPFVFSNFSSYCLQWSPPRFQVSKVCAKS